MVSILFSSDKSGSCYDLAVQLEDMRRLLLTSSVYKEEEDGDDTSDDDLPCHTDRSAAERPLRKAGRPAPPAGGVIEYPSSGGILQYEVVEGKRHGMAVRSFGGETSIFFYVDGVMQGKAATFFSDNSAITFFFKDGVPQGPAMAVQGGTPGKMKRDITFFTFVDGTRQGKAHSISSRGQVMHFNYVDGMKQGRARCEKPSGAILTCTFVDDLAQGKAFEKRPDGTIYELQCLDDSIIGEKKLIRGPTTTYRLDMDFDVD